MAASSSSTEQEGPKGYDFEPSMTEEQYREMVARTDSSQDPDNSSDSEEEQERNDDRVGNTAWCTCGLCEAMPSRVESICCREVRPIQDKAMDSCVTLHENFDSVCLNRDVLLTTWELLQYTKGNRPTRNLENRQYRFIAYKMFTLWGHGRLGKGNRRPIPSCAVRQIQLKFPEPDADYTGFSYAEEVLAAHIP